MSETLSYSAKFDGAQAFTGLRQLRDLLKTTRTAANDASSSIQSSFGRMGSTRVEMPGLDQLVRQMRQASAETERATREMRAAVESIPAPISRSSVALGSFAGTLGALGFQSAINGLKDLGRSFTDFSDKAGSIEAKLNLATAKFGSYAQAQKDVVAIANTSRSDLGSVSDLYATMARNATTLGLSQQQVAAATQTVGMALKIGGAGAAQASSAILQLSQAMAAGKLAGDEFSSINENAPRLMELFADAIGKPRGELKKLASDGKITAAVIAKALTDPKLVAGIEKEFGKIPVSFADIRTAAGNTFTLLAGQFAKGFGIADSLAVVVAKVQTFGSSLQPTFAQIGASMREVFNGLLPILTTIQQVGGAALSFLLNNMTGLVSVAKAAAASFLAFKAAAAVTWIMTTVRGIVALETALGASGVASSLFSAGMKACQRAVMGLTTAIAANPIGFIAVALTATIALLYEFRDAIGIGGGSIASIGDVGRAAFEMISETASEAFAVVRDFASGVGSWFTETFSGLGDMARDVFGSVGDWFADTFGGMMDMAGKFFDGIDFSLLGMARLVARTLDAMLGHWRGTYNVMIALFTGLPKALSTIFVNAFNGATAIVEGFINKTIQGVNRVLSFANSLGAAFGQLENVSLGRLAGGGAVALGGQMGSAYASAFTKPIETGLNKLVTRADKIAKDRKAKAKAEEKAEEKANAKTPPAQKPAGDGKKDDKKKKAADDAAKAEKKYADAVTDLNNRIKDLTLTQEQKALADELERAGLGRDIKQVNAKADAIRNLFKTLRDGEQLKKVDDIIKDFNDKVRELTYSQEQLALVEARRRAGLNVDLTYSDALTKKLDAETAAWYRKAKAKEAAQAVKEIERDQTQRKEDIEVDNRARTNSDKAEDERRVLQIQRERDANIERIRLLEGVTEAKRAELILNEQNLAKQLEQGVAMDRQAQAASSLANFLTAMWDGPKQAFKTFISGVLRGLLEAIAKAVILGEKLGGKGGIGGLLTSVISGALGGSSGVAGARASGGSVAAGKTYLVGERGPELMKFGAAGTIINNKTARRAIGAGGGSSISIGDTHIVIQGGAGADTQSQIAAQMAAYKRSLMADIDARLAKKR
ncbi:tape measure protein [Sphingobium sp. KCTC 72723]|uniref:tape measure protein n=1 Tax=Sphingobium sp. KCTC 72723 TaxID=2733867 RepID=UPI0021D02E1B|nr:tape measure protein [Sphingobium sp. KCTC 72723]